MHIARHITVTMPPSTEAASIVVPSPTALNHVVNVKVGTGSEQCMLEFHPFVGDSIRYTSHRAYARLLNGLTLNVKVHEDTVKLGPLVGIFVSKGLVNSIARGEPKFRITEIVRVNKEEATLVYFFTVGDIDFNAKLINAYHYRYDEQEWVKGWLPLPDVLWDRGGGFLPKHHDAVRHAREFLYRHCPIKINARYHFSKWEVHKRLSKHKDINHYLPETILYRRPQNLMAMLHKHGEVYVKDVYGSNGRNVMRIHKNDHGYTCVAFRDQLFLRECTTFPQVIAALKGYFGQALLIVQQGIKAVSHEGRKIDFRALVQRDESGQWKLTAMPMRIAGPQSPVTSTASGSTVVQVWQGLTEVLGFGTLEAMRIYNDLLNCLKQIVPAIEQEYGRFGEIGIDLALDEQGQIWYFECNAKPGKDTVVLAGDQEEIDLAFARPLKYAKFLTHFLGEWTNE